MLNLIVWNRTAYMYKMDLALNYQQCLICKKTRTNQIKCTNLYQNNLIFRSMTQKELIRRKRKRINKQQNMHWRDLYELGWNLLAMYNRHYSPWVLKFKRCHLGLFYEVTSDISFRKLNPDVIGIRSNTVEFKLQLPDNQHLRICF